MRPLATLLFLVSLSFPVIAGAEPTSEEAAALAKRGVELFQEGRYLEAEAALALAYQKEQRPELLYMRAQALRFASNCTRAVELYREYLDTEPGEREARAAEQAIAECEVAPSDEAVSTDARAEPNPGAVGEATNKEDPVEPAIEARKPAIQRSSRTSWTDDWIGHALVVGGLSVAGAGSYLWISARRDAPRSARVADYSEFDSEASDVERRALWGGAALAVGASLIVGGLVHYVFHTRERNTSVLGAQVRQEGGAVFVFEESF